MLQCTQQFGYKDGHYGNFYRNENDGNNLVNNKALTKISINYGNQTMQ